MLKLTRLPKPGDTGQRYTQGFQPESRSIPLHHMSVLPSFLSQEEMINFSAPPLQEAPPKPLSYSGHYLTAKAGPLFEVKYFVLENPVRHSASLIHDGGGISSAIKFLGRHFTPSRMAIIKNTDNNKGPQGYVEIATYSARENIHQGNHFGNHVAVPWKAEHSYHMSQQFPRQACTQEKPSPSSSASTSPPPALTLSQINKIFFFKRGIKYWEILLNGWISKTLC